MERDQGDKWIDEVAANNPGQAVQEVFLKHGLSTTEGMKAVEFDRDVNDMNVPFVPYGSDLEEAFETEDD